MKDEKQPIRVGLDIDGVLAFFQAAFIKECGGNPDHWRKWDNWDFQYCPVGMSPEDRLKVWETVQTKEKFWNDIAPAPGADIKRVAEESRNHPFYFITHRPKSMFAVTAHWLVRQGIEPTGLLFIKDKRRACSGLKISAFLDDYDEVVDSFDGYQLRAYLIDRPWNAHVKSAHRVQSVGEFLDKILNS